MQLELFKPKKYYVLPPIIITYMLTTTTVLNSTGITQLRLQIGSLLLFGGGTNDNNTIDDAMY